MRAVGIIALLAVTAAACSGDSTGPDSDPGGDTTPTGPVTGIIDPAGGSVRAVAPDGASITLTFPEGAVRTATSVTVRPVEPGGDLVRAALEPAGLVFRKPFTLAMVLPEGTDLTDASLTLGSETDAVPLATTVEPASRRVTSTALSFFGFTETGVMPPGGAFSRLGSAEGDGNIVGVSVLPCQAIIATAQAEFDGFIALGLHERAIRAALAGAGALADKDCEGALAFVDQATATACAGAGAVVQAIRSEPIDGHGDFQRLATDVVHWVGLAQQLGAADCDAVSEMFSALNDAATVFVVFFQGSLAGVTAGEYDEYQDLKDEARDIIMLQATAYRSRFTALGDMLEEEAFKPVVQAMRTAAYAFCRNDGWHYPLSRLTPAGFYALRDIVGIPSPRPGPGWPAPGEYAGLTFESVAADLQYCGTDLTIETVDTAGQIVATAQAGSGGGPGLFTADVSLAVPTEGTIRIAGELAGFTCWDNSAADQSIVVRLNGVPVHTIARTGTEPYLGGEPLELDIETIAEAAGVSAADGGSYPLVLRRLRTNCDPTLWGPAEFDLVTADLSWNDGLEWHFDSGLDGWSPGAHNTGSSFGAAEWGAGAVVLRGYGEGGVANAWVSRTVQIPAGATELRFGATAGCVKSPNGRDTGDSAVRARITTAGGADDVLLDWTTVAESSSYQSFSRSISAYAGQTVTIFFEMDDEGDQEEPADDEVVCVDDVIVS